jgi:hypothetical protein
MCIIANALWKAGAYAQEAISTHSVYLMTIATLGQNKNKGRERERELIYIVNYKNVDKFQGFSNNN